MKEVSQRFAQPVQRRMQRARGSNEVKGFLRILRDMSHGTPKKPRHLMGCEQCVLAPFLGPASTEQGAKLARERLPRRETHVAEVLVVIKSTTESPKALLLKLRLCIVLAGKDDEHSGFDAIGKCGIARQSTPCLQKVTDLMQSVKVICKQNDDIAKREEETVEKCSPAVWGQRCWKWPVTVHYVTTAVNILPPLLGDDVGPLSAKNQQGIVRLRAGRVEVETTKAWTVVGTLHGAKTRMKTSYRPTHSPTAIVEDQLRMLRRGCSHIACYLVYPSGICQRRGIVAYMRPILAYRCLH